MPRVGIESTSPVFERAKTVHALDRATTVIGSNLCIGSQNGLFLRGFQAKILYACLISPLDSTYHDFLPFFFS
jgi:hypothetical protein